MGKVLDLNAERKARAALREAEAKTPDGKGKATPPTFKHGKTTFVCPDEMPLRFSILAGKGEMVQAFEVLLGDQAPLLWSETPPLSTPDMEVLSQYLAEEYGFADMGESPPSDGS